MTMVLPNKPKVLCPKCHGNGVNRLPHGVAVCPRCLGHCEIHREYLTPAADEAWHEQEDELQSLRSRLDNAIGSLEIAGKRIAELETQRDDVIDEKMGLLGRLDSASQTLAWYESRFQAARDAWDAAFGGDATAKSKMLDALAGVTFIKP